MQGCHRTLCQILPFDRDRLTCGKRAGIASYGEPTNLPFVFVWEGCTLRLKRPLSFVASLLLLFFASPLAAGQHAVPQYVGTDVCAGCHRAEMEAWQGSHHAKAWVPVLPETVLGDFDNKSFTLNGVTSRFFRDGGTHMIETDGPDGQITRYPVHSVVGIEPLQQYLLETEPGRLQSFDVVWDTERDRWIHLYPEQELYAGDGLHWTGPYKNWNARCAECHATGFQKNYAPVQRTYQSTQAEIGVGCEACHGPGEAHLAWAQGDGVAPSQVVGLTDRGLTIDLNKGAETLLQQCAGCHARREPYEDGNPIPGTAFHDGYRLSLLREGTYHADGQILDEVYVYGSFLQSKMYASGVTCNDCHTPHSAELRATGNGVCTQCHSEAGNPRFPTLTLQNYDAAEHHFHDPDSEAGQCKSCHMIERTYMAVDGRRDHSFRIPRPDLSLETRSPNACTDCHSDRTSSWAAEALEDWFPESENRRAHYGQAIAAGRRDLRSGVEDLVQLVEDEDQPGIARAMALEMLGGISTAGLATRLAPLLDDPDPLVRAAAVSAQRGAPELVRAERLSDLLDDPARAVRMGAAREFLGMPGISLTADAQRKLQTAIREWQSTLRIKADFPETQLVLGGIGLTMRRFDSALQAFGEAVTLDPQLEQAWVMQVRIHAALGNLAAARATADAAIEANPESIALYLLRSELN